MSYVANHPVAYLTFEGFDARMGTVDVNLQTTHMGEGFGTVLAFEWFLA